MPEAVSEHDLPRETRRFLGFVPKKAIGFYSGSPAKRPIMAKYPPEIKGYALNHNIQTLFIYGIFKGYCAPWVSQDESGF